MKNSVAPDPKDRQKILEPLVNVLVEGFTESARKSLHGSASATCTAVERLSLRDELRPDARTFGIEFQFDAGISGRMLIVIPQPDLAWIAGLLSGLELAQGEALSADMMEACLQFFESGAEGAGRSFASLHGLTVHAAAPRVVNPEGGGESLIPLSESYSNAPRMTFRLHVENRPDVQMGIWITEDLLASLQSQLPQYKSEASGGSGVAQGSRAPTAGPGLDSPANRWNIDLILDVELEVAVSFGETQMPLRDILKLGVGSVVELEKGVNDPVTVFVNEKPIARGEVVVVDGNYGVKVMQVESTADRIRSLG